MVDQFQEVARKLAALPAAQQARWIAHFLEELQAQAGDTGVETVTAGDWIAGRRPSRASVTVAVEQLRRFRQGKLLDEDLSLPDLIDEGGRA